jgi:sporulation protein YlmC with PRC-barrel domain
MTYNNMISGEHKMFKFRILPVLFVLIALILAACAPASQTRTNSGGGRAESNGEAATSDSSAPAVKAKKPPQTNAAGIIPPERREELTRLSSLLELKLIGLDGAALGQVSDFIINTCETYIIYFTVEPARGLQVAGGQQLIIPFEVVTINSGALDAETQSISIYMTPEQVAAAPAFANDLALFPNTWEETVRAYWLQVARVSPLTSECKAGGSDSANAVHKIAYASQLLGAELKDGNQVLLGTVLEAVLEPESGKLGFYVVQLLDDSLVMVPLGQTNIPKEALAPGQTIELVLLSETNLLLDAPRIASIEEAMNAQTQSNARGYWNK